MPFECALNHRDYSCWLPIFINNMKILKIKHLTVFKEFQKGSFTAQKSISSFSSMLIAQAHEQNNKIIKTDGGATNILPNSLAFIK